MKTKLLLTSSALFLGLLGGAATFIPQEILAYHQVAAGGFGVHLLQVLGAAYLGFAMVNWMHRGNLMGGIYNRPVALGNFLHFTVVAIAFMKGLAGGSPNPTALVATALYAIFAIWFGLVLWTHPLPEK